MKKYILLLFTLILTLPLLGQLEVKEGSFKEVPGFVNINTEKMYDDNDKPYAVLKIKTENISSKERHELNFKGDAQTFFEVEYKDGEVWLYISYYATFIKISHDDFSSTEFHFPFDMKPKCGYELTLINKKADIDEQTIINLIDQRLENTHIASNNYQNGYITVRTSPKGADVFVDNVKVGTTPYLSEPINTGNHKISVGLNGYEPMAKRVIIGAGQEEIVEFTLIADDIQESLKTNQNNAATAINVIVKSGVFTVGHNKRVKFSPGNLQYHASTNTWRFAERQWEVIGNDNKNISSTYDGWIDLFGWGTGNDPTKSTIEDTYYEFNEWGDYVPNDNGKKWRTMTKYEWSYVIDERKTTSNIRFAMAKVNDINGMILLPDNWEKSYYHLLNTNNKRALFTDNIISLLDWTNIFENYGAVFLPVAGHRGGLTVRFVQEYGDYWSSTKNSQDNSCAFGVSIDGSNLYPDCNYYRSGGQSVRLVQDY